MGTRFGNDDDVLFLNGSSTPRGFYAEFPVNESVVIRFESDYSVAYQGFWIRVSAMDERSECLLGHLFHRPYYCFFFFKLNFRVDLASGLSSYNHL